jgi:hypothetical protein
MIFITCFIPFLRGEGPRSRCYGRTTALRLFVQPLWWRAVFLPSFTSNGAPVEWNWQGKTDNSEKNLSQCHFVHHKSHMDLTWDRTRASAVRGRWLTAWAMARPCFILSVRSRVRFQVGSLEIFQVTYSFCSRSVALRSTQPLTEMITKEFPREQNAAGVVVPNVKVRIEAWVGPKAV